MLLAPESHKHIESFLQDHFHIERLKLPPVHVYCGRFARWLTSRFGIIAITFSQSIFIAPKVVKRDEKNRLTVPAALVAHEAIHVVQYDKAGFIRFLISYLSEYLRVLREQKQGWGKAARHAAYLAIRQEREAYAAESAFEIWRLQEKMREVKTSSLRDVEEDGAHE